MNHILQCTVFSVVLVIGLGGCATTQAFEDKMGHWVGQGFYSFHAAYGPPDSVEFVGDKRIFKYTLRGYKDCTVYWTVDKTGTIVDWRHEGKGCKSEVFIING